MKKRLLLFLSILFFSQYTFSQFEDYLISNVGIVYNSSIIETAITVPQGKVWKVISAKGLNIIEPNGVTRDIGYIGYEKGGATSTATVFITNMVLPSGYGVYSGSNEGVFNYIEYDLSQPRLSYAEPLEDNKPILFPNPTSSLLALNSDKEYDIEVYDMAGNKVMALTGNTIDMSHLSSATYIVKALDKVENEEVSYKVVKN